MAILSSFCFYFSCRLGSLIVGVFNMVQIFIWLGICIHYSIYSDKLKESVIEYLEDEDLNLSNISEFLNSLKDNPDKYLNWGIAFFSIFSFSCVAMMYGVYKLKTYIVYPFVIIDLFYITSLLVIYVMALLIIKANDHGLGPLISFSILGEFIFIYKYYTWFVVFSYCQIVYELKKNKNIDFIKQTNEEMFMYSKKLSAYPRLY